jgi:hypothetical protein
MIRKNFPLGLVCAVVVSAQIIAPSSANAEVVNLVCDSGNNPLNYWVDTEKNVIIFPKGDELPAEIDSQLIKYHLRGTANLAVEINRTSGEMNGISSSGVPMHMAACAKGTTPLPAAKF